jgi:hypothetical protein
VVWKPYIIEEIEHPEEHPVQDKFETGEEQDARIDREELARPRNGCKLSLAMADALADEGIQYIRFALPSSKSPNVPVSTSQFGSPCLSKFESYLGECEAKVQTQTVYKQGMQQIFVYERAANVSNNEWWKSVLLSEKERLEDDKQSRLVQLEDILPDQSSSDDDIPI